MIKQVLVFRYDDLKIRLGKRLAQAGHAALAFLAVKDETGPLQLTPPEREWLFGDQTKICLRAKDEAELRAIHESCQQAGLQSIPIIDLGRTEFQGVPTQTCLAIGPDEAEKIDPITGHLELL